jgi:phosphoenolpyruvate synthase/pyruvate phosphate dikinase
MHSAAVLQTALGGKGANLAEMAKLGLPVPPGFTISPAVCTAFYENDRSYPSDADGDQVEAALAAGSQGRQDVRRSGKSAAGVGALRAPAPPCRA